MVFLVGLEKDILLTKLYIPKPRPKAVRRPRLVEKLSEGMHRKLTLISAPAGYGKTALVSEWLADAPVSVAWLSLDGGDDDLGRFLRCVIAAMQTIEPSVGKGLLPMPKAAESSPSEAMLLSLLHDLHSLSPAMVLVLDDYHLLRSPSIHEAVAFLLERMPPQLHLVITTRAQPPLPLARMRAKDQLTEVHAGDLRFAQREAGEFLCQGMGLVLSETSVGILAERTEGWIAGLQLVALALRREGEPDRLIQSFPPNHPYVWDYLVEEVLNQETESIQSFLLQTSVLERMSGPLCDAVLSDGEHTVRAGFGEATLALLDRANLFLVALNSERRWYRYHHLFAELLRKRLDPTVAASLHIRASSWYEANGFALEAFHHAVCAHDTKRAARLAEGAGLPLIFRGAVTPVLQWLESLGEQEKNELPGLWVMQASALLMTGKTTGVEPKLQAAEKVLQAVEQSDMTRDLLGHIAAIRASLAVSKHDAERIVAESHRALELLHPENVPVRTATLWARGYGCQLRGEWAEASVAYTQALANSERVGHVLITMLATLGLGMIQEMESRLYLGERSYLRVLKLAGDPPLPAACKAHLGLARLYYEWDEREKALEHTRQSVKWAKQLEQTDCVVESEIFLARLKLAQGDASGAARMLAESDHTVQRQNFTVQLPQLLAVQTMVQLHKGNLAAAERLATANGQLASTRARVYLAKGNSAQAVAILKPWHQELEQTRQERERIEAKLLLAVALLGHGEKRQAVQLLREALALAEPGGLVRTFVDEAALLLPLLREWTAAEAASEYCGKLLAAMNQLAPVHGTGQPAQAQQAESLIEPLSNRELEVLRLIAQGFSNQQISERLFIALPTVKGHNRVIFEKLQVKRRTEAVARARELGLL